MAHSDTDPPTLTVTISLTVDELELLCAALDSHMYWQLSDESNRDSGHADSPDADDESAAEFAEAEALLRRLEEHRRIGFGRPADDTQLY